MMKILCTADWHIGKKLEGFSRLDEQKLILQKIVEITQQEQVDAIIIAGDCFDTQSPTPEMTKLFVSVLAKLSRECLVLVIAGNHDNPLFLSSSEAFASQLGVLILGYPFDVPTLEENSTAWKVLHYDRGVVEILFKKSKKVVRFLLSPYANAQRLKKDLGTNNTDKKAWELLCDEWQNQISHDENITNILVTHSYLLPEKRELFQDEDPKEDSEERSIVGTLGAISLSFLPKGIDYVIAGHIHKPQALYSPHTKAYYTGSPLVYSLSESGQQKSLLMLELARKNKETLIPLPQIRDVKKIQFDDFKTIEETLIKEKENYLVLIWEGDRYFTSEEHQFLRNNHQYLLRVESHPKLNLEYTPQSVEKLKEQSTEELFEEYFRAKHSNQSPPDDLLQMFRECHSEESQTKTLLKKRGFLPKSLIVQGFYSYRDKVEIDFELLEQKGFFGIFGNTGSGKSALIEAMIVAIFYRVERIGTFGAKGKGNFSNAYGIMNLDSDELLVEFSFEIIGTDGLEEYLCRIHGKRDKKKPLEVKLTREVFCKDQNEWIPSDVVSGEELLGISYDDFRKTIVLQQQDFLGFISADPKENTETLMRLFQLERFDLYHTVDRIEKSEYGEFQNVKNSLEKLQDIDEKKIEDMQKLQEDLQDELQASKQKLDKTQTHLTQLKNIIEQQQHTQDVKRRLDNLERELDTFQKAKERLLIFPIVEWDIDISKKERDIAESKQELISLEQQLTNTSTQLETVLQQGKKTQQLLQKLEELRTQKQLDREQILSSTISEELLKCESQKKEVSRIQGEFVECGQKIKDIQQKLLDKSSIENQCEHLHIQETKLRDLQGLATAVKHLEENCPCPLCGSSSHPTPYQAQSSDELQKIMLELKNSQQQLAHLSQEELSLKDLQKRSSEYQQILTEHPSSEELQETHENLLQQKQHEDSLLEELKLELENTQKEYQEYFHKVDELKNTHIELSKSQEVLKTKLENTHSQIEKDSVLLAIDVQDRAKYIQDFSVDMEQFTTIKSYPQKTQQEVNKFFEEYLLCTGEIKGLQNIIMDDVTEELAQTEQLFNTLNHEYTVGQQQIGSYKNEIQNLTELLKQKQKLEVSFSVLSTRHDNLEFLKKLFKGSGFVHFIGQKYLSKLCHTANGRFLRFTQNQFELSPPEEFDDKKGRIMVIDRLSGGNKRDMQTLSGGQSFQAALSLALALADESGAGHRFFFVDEGFGTLDQDSLMIVLDSLRDLVSIENRVVGVISHIPLMKDEVNAFIQVSLDKVAGTVISFHE